MCDKFWLLFLGALLVSAGLLCAQDGGKSTQLSDEQFDEQSMAYRKALYYDPALEAPLQKLIDLYRARDEVDVLTGIYQSHVATYPQDPNGRAVLVRLLLGLSKPEAGQFARNAVDAFPDNALIQYLHYTWLESTKDPRALDVLSKAVSLETQAGRKEKWIDQLIAQAALEDRRDLSKKHLEELAALPGQTAQTLLALAQKMNKGKFHDLALEILTRAETLTPSPELRVDIVLLAAAAQAAMGQHEAAGERLDALLKKVAPDYWRRSELVSRRVNLLKTDAAREAMLKKVRAAYDANPASEAAVLDYSELLIACELRRDALNVLREAAKSGRVSERIEDALLGLFERLNDLHGARDYLKGRVAESPERADLAYRYLKTLFVTGGAKEAQALLATVLEGMGEEERVNQMLDLARYLRRMSQPAEAADIFLKIVETRPERLDVRRELAEAYIAIGKRQAARALFTADLARDAELENFLDVVQFMIQQEILIEAKKALETRMANDSSFDVRMLLVDVLGKLGEQLPGGRLVDESRAMADTDARYSRWLESGARFHELFDTMEVFFESEQARLQGDGSEIETWTEKSIARFVTFCEVAGRNDGRERIVALLKTRVADEALPDDLRLRLRRMLVGLLERNPDEAQELKLQLDVLAGEDGEHEQDYRLMAARMHHTAQEAHLAAPIFSEIDFSKINDARLLGGLHTILIEYGLTEQALAALERATKLEPTNRSHWSGWISALAATGEEERLRTALRRLLAGVDRMALKEETFDLLRAHLVDSYWRSAARILAEADAENMGEIFPILDAIERSKKLDDDGLWVLWTRAYALNRQGRDKARDEAIDTLVRFAENRRAAKKTDETEALQIHFPDGLVVSLDAALAFLKDADAAGNNVVLAAAVSQGPMPPMALRWVFDGARSEIHEIVAVPSEKAVLVSDTGGKIYKVDLLSGKLLWSFEPASLGGESAASAAFNPQSGQSNYNWSSVFTQLKSTAPVVVDSERFYVAAPGGIAAMTVKDASLIWRAKFDWGNVYAPRVARPLTLIPTPERLLAYDAAQGLAAAFDLKSGKLLWRRLALPEDRSSMSARSMYLSDYSSGASYGAGYFLVYGLHSQVLDAASGDLIWSFEPSQTRKFPIELASPEESPTSIFSSLIPSGSFSSGGMMPRGIAMNHMAGRQERLGMAGTFITQEGTLAAPAVSWSDSLMGGINAAGYVHGQRMVLAGSNALSVYSLNLPLGGLQFNASGTFVGFSGNKLCMLSSSFLQVLDLTRGVTRSIPIAEATKTTGRVDAVIDGARVYVSGDAGVLCLNVHTQRKIFFEPWPQRLLEVRGKAEPESISSFYLQGVVPDEASKAPTIFANPGYRSNSPKTQRIFPFRSIVVDGMLITAIRPDMIAALEPLSEAEDGNKDD